MSDTPRTYVVAGDNNLVLTEDVARYQDVSELKQYVRHDDHLRLITSEREAREKAEIEVARLNKWADGMTDAALKERQTAEEYQRELRARVAELDKAIDEINVGVNAGNAVIWIESISGFYMSVREAIEAAIKEQNKGEKK